MEISSNVVTPHISLFIDKSPFPATYSTKLTYSSNIQYGTGTAGISGSEQLFSLTGVYDPDQTGTGHQPYGYDTITTLYSRYIVKKARARVRFTYASADMLVITGLRSDNSGSITTTGHSADFITENPCYVTRPLTTSGSNAVVEFVYDVQPWQLLGITKAQYTNDISNYGAATTGNPNIQAYLVINVVSLNGTANQTCTGQAIIDYFVEFQQRVPLTQS